MSAEIQLPPPPWRHISTAAVGGLMMVGFAEHSDLLLMISHNGAGVFNCLTGERIARDADFDPYAINKITLIAAGIGPLKDHRIRMAGLLGGSLIHSTLDGWFVKERAPRRPEHQIFLTKEQSNWLVAADSVCELRAFGFSQTGRSLIIATTCDLMFIARASA